MTRRKRVQTTKLSPESKRGASDQGAWRRALAAIVALYVVAALVVAWVVPFDPTPDPRLTPPDESAHWLFIRELATTGQLPIFTGDPGYEAHQPPLFYASALWTYGLLGDAGLRVARLWSALFGAFTLLAAWWASPYLLGPAPWPRVAMVASLALLPGRVFVVASVSNDALSECCAAFTLWLCLRALARGLDPRGSWAIGLALGLGLLTKTTALLLFAAVVPALVMEPSWRQVGWRRLIGNGLRIAVVVAALWGWWVARNLALYGEPLATQIFQTVFLKTRATPEFFLNRGISWSGYWTLVAWQTWMSLWGVFGQATVYMPRAFYFLGGLLAALSVLGWLWRWRRPPVAPADPALRRAWVVSLFVVLVTLALFLQFNSVFYQAQARYFLGVSLVLAAALAGGVCALAPGRSQVLAALALTGVLTAMTAWAIMAFITGGYSFRPPVG